MSNSNDFLAGNILGGGFPVVPANSVQLGDNIFTPQNVAITNDNASTLNQFVTNEYLQGQINAIAANSNYINIYISSTNAVSLINGQYIDMIDGGVTLSAGQYILNLRTYFSINITGSGTNNYIIQNGINTTAGNSGTGLQIMINSDKDSQNPNAAYQKSLNVIDYPVSITETTTFYAKAYVLGASASGNVYGNFSYIALN